MTQKEGVLGGDPFSWILLLYMMFILLAWFGTNNTNINPLAGNSTITGNFATSFTDTKWLMLLMAPFAVYLFITAFAGEGDMFDREHLKVPEFGVTSHRHKGFIDEDEDWEE